MPIQQSRVISIVQALRHVYDTFNAMRETLADITDEALATGDNAKALREITNVIELTQLPNDIALVLGAEEAHWRISARRNDLNKLRMRRTRGAIGTGLGHARQYGDNPGASHDAQRESARAYMRAQRREPIHLPADAIISADEANARATAQAQYDAEQHSTAPTKHIIRDEHGREVELEIEPEAPGKPNAPLLG